jgi:hypothetical protein
MGCARVKSNLHAKPGDSESESCHLFLRTRDESVPLNLALKWQIYMGPRLRSRLAEFRKDLPLYSAPAYVTEMKKRLSECEQYVTGRFQALVKEHDIISQDQRVKGNDFECLKDGKNSFCIFESSNPDAHFTSGRFAITRSRGMISCSASVMISCSE